MEIVTEITCPGCKKTLVCSECSGIYEFTNILVCPVCSYEIDLVQIKTKSRNSRK